MDHNLRTILTVMKWWRKAPTENETFFLSEDSMSMHGVLYKKGRNLVKKYKKRWFVLPDNSFYLSYYSAPHGKLLGQIDINNILNVQPLETNKKLYGLNLTTSSKVYALFARTLEERDGWCAGLTNRFRDIATTKISIREVVVPGPVLREDVPEQERNCQTFPKSNNPHRHSNSHQHQRTGTIRDSPRRALSDGMLRSSNGRLARYTPPVPHSLENPMGNIQSSPKGSPLKASLTLTGTSYILTENSLSSSRPSRNPIAISDDFNFSDTSTVIHNSTLDENTQGGLVRSPESSTAIDDPQQQAQLLAKLNRMEHIVEEKDATIAALSAMLKRQSIIPDAVRFTGGNGVTSPSSVGKNRGVQQHLDEYVGISMWLEQRKKSELEKDVHQLREANDELSILLEEERQKCQYLEREKYNMQCMIEHLEREKIKT